MRWVLALLLVCGCECNPLAGGGKHDGAVDYTDAGGCDQFLSDICWRVSECSQFTQDGCHKHLRKNRLCVFVDPDEYELLHTCRNRIWDGDCAYFEWVVEEPNQCTIFVQRAGL